MYKNWKAICQIEDTSFMWVLALLDLSTDFGRMVSKRFPKYFSSEEQMGPIPLSVIRILADNYTKAQAESWLIVLGILWRKEFNISIFTLFHLPADVFDKPTLPAKVDSQIKALDHQVKVGDIVIWQSERILILEVIYKNGANKSEGYFRISFAPTELIAIDK